MSVKGNFATVRRSDAGTSVAITGHSQDAQHVTALHVFVGVLHDLPGIIGAGGQLVDNEAAVQGSVAGAVGEDWEVIIATDAAAFALGTAVLLSGTAIRDQGPPDVWVQTAKVISDDAPSP